MHSHLMHCWSVMHSHLLVALLERDALSSSLTALLERNALSLLALLERNALSPNALLERDALSLLSCIVGA